MKISKRYSRLGTESAFEILSKAQKLASEGREIINLGIGQPDFSTPKHVVDSCKKALDDGYHGYTEPNGTLELREGVSNYIQRIYNTKIDSSEYLFHLVVNLRFFYNDVIGRRRFRDYLS